MRDPVAVAVLDLKTYLNGLASAQPTPGGGSAAAIVGALGAALLAMVARITLGSDRHREVHAQALLLVSAADTLRSRFVQARLSDEAAYGAVVAAQALPRATDAEKLTRTERLQNALIASAEAPLNVAHIAVELFELCDGVASLHNTHLVSDVACAIAFARAAFDASVANVRINHRFIKDARIVAAGRERLATATHAAATAEQRARTIAEQT